MKTLDVKIFTQKGLILNEMIKDPSRWFLCSDFCGGDPSLPFVGYKAPTRIAEMQKQGFISSRWSSRTTTLGTKLKEYKLSKSVYPELKAERIKITIQPKTLF